MRTKVVFAILTAVFILALALPAIQVMAGGDHPTPTGPYVRLRGSVEIHTLDCEKVKRADPAGIVSARLSDGPPCFYCLRKKLRK